ncbi:hypothetical protein OG337_35520 [[Kitasatospora] papulosa]|uniref:hypothetical protein n=1 Tax=Streptomyces TaxID=1883 RepID=UPI00068B4542|nr:hypothetical protein [Streptomyces flavovirens]WSZ52349.1 hypothetical protein OG337_35520 [[Kitasatospora] papulosa]
MQETPNRHTFGTPDKECRYPVLLNGKFVGHVFRWHRAWFAVTPVTQTETRVSAGAIGKDAAARYLCDEADAGRITPQNETPTPQELRPSGPLLLLHPRMKETPHNLAAARVAWRSVTDDRWVPMGGYPGADNPWLLSCGLCGWKGVRYWSHLRGRNGNPPSAFRHPGCARPQ